MDLLNSRCPWDTQEEMSSRQLTRGLNFQRNILIENVRASLIAQLVKDPPAMQETLVQSPGWEDPLEKG